MSNMIKLENYEQLVAGILDKDMGIKWGQAEPDAIVRCILDVVEMHGKIKDVNIDQPQTKGMPTRIIYRKGKVDYDGKFAGYDYFTEEVNLKLPEKMLDGYTHPPVEVIGAEFFSEHRLAVLKDGKTCMDGSKTECRCEEYRKRLEFSPFGDDKIDELNEANKQLKLRVEQLEKDLKIKKTRSASSVLKDEKTCMDGSGKKTEETRLPIPNKAVGPFPETSFDKYMNSGKKISACCNADVHVDNEVSFCMGCGEKLCEPGDFIITGIGKEKK